MGFHLALGLDHEPEAPAVAGQRGRRPDCEAARVPERVQEARAIVQFLQSPGAPSQMVGFLGGRGFKVRPRRGIARERGLPVVQRLRADLAGMVHAHQPGDVAASLRVQLGQGQRFAWRRTRGDCSTGHGVQGALEATKQQVERCGATDIGIHATIVAHPRRRGLNRRLTVFGSRLAGRRVQQGLSRLRGNRGAVILGGLSLLSTPSRPRGAAPHHVRTKQLLRIVPMKTFSAKAETVKRDWLVVDADGKTLGRLCSEVARRLRGKHKPEFTPHVDTGDYIVVVNAEKVAVTGNKLEAKNYHRFTGYVGNLKTTNLKDLLATHPERAIEFGVKGMLPKNPLGRAMFRKLKVYRGAEHPHTAQQPKALEI